MSAGVQLIVQAGGFGAVATSCVFSFPLPSHHFYIYSMTLQRNNSTFFFCALHETILFVSRHCLRNVIIITIIIIILFFGSLGICLFYRYDSDKEKVVAFG